VSFASGDGALLHIFTLLSRLITLLTFIVCLQGTCFKVLGYFSWGFYVILLNLGLAEILRLAFVLWLFVDDAKLVALCFFNLSPLSHFLLGLWLWLLLYDLLFHLFRG
jgi:hypothetical protein